MKKNNTFLLLMLLAGQILLISALSAQSASKVHSDTAHHILSDLAANKVTRKTIHYDLPGVSNQSEIDRSGRWAFRIGFNASLERKMNLDYIPTKENLRKETKEGNLTAEAEVFRIGKIYINSTSIAKNATNFFNKNSYDGTQTDHRMQVLSSSHNSTFRLNQHFATVVRAGYDRIYTEEVGVSNNTQNQFNIGPGIEANVFPYRNFYKKYWLVGTYYKASISKSAFHANPKEYQPGLYTKAASLTNWGFWQAGIGIEGSKIARKAPETNYYGNISINYNLGKGLYAAVNIYGNKRYTTGNSDQLDQRSSDFFCGAGLSYFFGSGRENVLNPRMVMQ